MSTQDKGLMHVLIGVPSLQWRSWPDSTGPLWQNITAWSADKMPNRYTRFADNMDAYVEKSYSVVICSPIMKLHSTEAATTEPSIRGSTRSADRGVALARLAAPGGPPPFLVYKAAVRLRTGHPARGRTTPILFLYGVQARPGGGSLLPASATASASLLDAQTATAVVFVPNGFDDHEKNLMGATYLVDPTLLMAAPQDNDPRDAELCKAFLDLKVHHACRNDNGELAATAVGIPVAHIDKMGFGQPRITTEDDCTPPPTPPRRTTRHL